MSTPRFWSKDAPTHKVDGTTVLANPGNWKQFPSGEPLDRPRYIYRWFIDGKPYRTDYDAIPQTTAPDKMPAGVGQDVLDVSRFGPGPHQVVFQVWAGNYFTGWGDHPDDAIEWGGDHVTEGARSPYVVGLTVTVPGAPPPPPPPSTRPPTPAETKAKMISAARQWENGLKQQAPLSRITLSRRILQTTDAQWTPEIAAAVAELINPS